MRAIIVVSLALASCALPALGWAQSSNLPLPRFVSLGDYPANVRAGPGENYPVEWVYTRRELPLKVVAENDVWRKIVDWEGETGWIHSRLLAPRRMAMTIAAELTDLRRSPSRNAVVLSRAEPGVIGEIKDCQAHWCFVEFANLHAWVRREEIWGIELDDDRDFAG